MSSVILEINAVPKFAFLALPSPPRKKRAAVNNTFRAPASPVNRTNAILTWAETVLPGSPAPITPASGGSLPHSASFVSSPHLQAFRHPSLARFGSRRQSGGSTRSRTHSASFLHVTHTPKTPAHPNPMTPFSADTNFDFTAFGYASIFVDVPASTPVTPGTHHPKPMTRLPSRDDPTTKSTSTGIFKRLLGNKPKTTKSHANAQKSGGEAATNTVVSDYLSVSLAKRSKYTEQLSSAIEGEKREIYAAGLPPTVTQEAQMRQTMEGGSLERNIQKVMEEKATREGVAVKVAEGIKVVEGVETAHRDGQGGIWWDQEEQWEFAHLLGANRVPSSARCSNAEGWVTFNHLKEFEKDDFSEFSSLPSSKYTDLHHSRPMVIDEAAERFVRGRAERCSSVAGSIVVPSPSVKPSNILLAIPSRPNRGRHLQSGFLNDVIAVPPTPSTPSAFSQTSSRPPRSPARATRFIMGPSPTSGSTRRQRSRSRSLPRRQRKPAPPPLKIIPIRPVNKLAVNVVPGEDAKAFLEDSFKPGPVAMAPQLSKETIAPRPLLASLGNSGTQMNDFALVSVPKKSRRLGGFFGRY